MALLSENAVIDARVAKAGETQRGIPAQRLTPSLKAKAKSLGFDAFGVVAYNAATKARLAKAGHALEDWLKNGHHGTMAYMAHKGDLRANPALIMPNLSSIIMLGMNYGPERDPRESLGNTDAATISVYARNADYHALIKGRLKTFAAHLSARARALGLDAPDIKVFVDTAAVMEKPLAMLAGLGWQGRHTNLVSRDFGSWLFLGAVFTSLQLTPTRAARDHCGTCRACLDVCPTGAFPAPYQLDARRCISYLTIEHHGAIPLELRKAMGNRIYGCDDCLAVCPWNKFARATHEIKLQARADLTAPRLRDLLVMDEPAFRAKFAGNPIKRIGHARFLRNVLIACGNSGDKSLLPALAPLMHHEDEHVRESALWAQKELLRAQAHA